LSNFSRVPLGKAPLSIIDGDRGSNYPKKTEFFGEGHCWFLNTSNVKSAGFDFGEMGFITAKKDSVLSKGKLRRHDIVLTTRGTIGNCAYFGDSIPFEHIRINSGMVILRAEPSQLDPYFLYVFLRSEIFKTQTGTHSSGSAQPQLPIVALKNIVIPLFALPHQRKIAAVLSALDTKIELNHQINGELEGLAKLLYDYWFVQYDFPLSAAQAAALGKPRLAGQPYRTSGGKMLFNPTLKREIPKEWTCATLGELFNLYQPQTITDKDLKPDGDYFVYGANGIVGKYDRFNHEKPQIALTCRGSTCGNLTRTLPRSWITGNAMVMAPRDPNLDIEYIFNVANASGIGAIITGSGQPQITRTNLQGVKTISPDPDTLARYQGFAHPISQHRISLEQQNQELTALRDWLLPMLMNGQVRVECPESRGIPQKGKPNK
jgi:type I restriction enzyme, S subunit